MDASGANHRWPSEVRARIRSAQGTRDPLGWLINERDPLNLDLPAIIKAARQRGCCLELNAQPQRMDLFDLQCRYAKDEGVLISINSDAHRTADFAYLRYGVAQARRAWLENPNILNTRSLTELKAFLTSGSARG